MSAQRTIRITSFAGSQLAQVGSVDPSSLTGWELKCRLAEAMGFPTVSFSLISADGKQIEDSSSVQETLGQDACESEPIPISCVLGSQKAVGAKNSERRAHISKTGMALIPRIVRYEKNGLVKKLRVPDSALRESATVLLCESFAPELEELIGIGVEAAYHQTSEDACAATHGQYVFKDAPHGVCVDMSSCRLWMSVVEDERLGHSRFQNDKVVSAVLWRLLDGWSGAPEGALGGRVRPGPVLEVLFLATKLESRVSGVAKQLMADLEAVATDLGCAAVAVAAVPVQGCHFWRGCGYEVAVPLAEEDCGPGRGFGEPVSALGEFLLDRMLLFSDTPLVAKVLVAE
jgi:GNAT superfamily N-acetyltransferase